MGRAIRAAALVGAALAATAAGGELRGTATFAGAPPAAVPLEVTKDDDACGKSVPDETVEVSGGGLANVVVVVRGLPSPPARAQVVLDQRRCRYAPHVQAVPVGSTLEIVNSDPVLHNIHGYLGQATAFNFAMPRKDQKVTKVLRSPGLVRVKCDVHDWMAAFVMVVDGPAAVTRPNGSFAIPDLPPGTYTVTAWHEKLGERTAQVAVPATGEAVVRFAFGG
ncbi:MAG TPA: TonB-dependent receptor [Anaeromyxobacteraceae bacterium]|nr:TonB-dependent receptor [Anaeromyxobacteraceae bacterium]